MGKTMMVEDGYNGSRQELSLEVQQVDAVSKMVRLGVAGKPWLIRWVRIADYRRAVVEAGLGDVARYMVPSAALATRGA